MYKDTGDPKWTRVKGVFLPDLSKKELKQLEHRLQIAHTFKEDYDPITLFLDCRKMHREGGLDIEGAGKFFQREIQSKKDRGIYQTDRFD